MLSNFTTSGLLILALSGTESLSFTLSDLCKGSTLSEKCSKSKRIGNQIIIKCLFKNEKRLRSFLIQDQVVFVVKYKRGVGFEWRCLRKKPLVVNFVRNTQTQVRGKTEHMCAQKCLCCVYWKSVCVFEVSTLLIWSSGKPSPTSHSALFKLVWFG